ncbi:MAG: histidine phosphatase family protein [Solobacterium sp.]|nr:histidine phosphatase family protein [Solobacterium sp.]
MKVTFYYVRHGQTEFNLRRIIQGSCDSPLTEKGINDARRAKEALRSIPFDKAFCSSSERAVDTADIILECHNVKAKHMKGLKEFHYGSMDGESIDDHREEIDRRHGSFQSWKDLGGDDNDSMDERIDRTLNRILAECRDRDNVLIVSHGNFCLHLMRHLFGIDMLEFRLAHKRSGKEGFAVPNGGIMKFEWEDGRYKLLSEPCEPEEFRNT